MYDRIELSVLWKGYDEHLPAQNMWLFCWLGHPTREGHMDCRGLPNLAMTQGRLAGAGGLLVNSKTV